MEAPRVLLSTWSLCIHNERRLKCFIQWQRRFQMKAGLTLAKMLATASDRCSNKGSLVHYYNITVTLIHLQWLNIDRFASRFLERERQIILRTDLAGQHCMHRPYFGPLLLCFSNIKITGYLRRDDHVGDFLGSSGASYTRIQHVIWIRPRVIYY